MTDEFGSAPQGDRFGEGFDRYGRYLLPDPHAMQNGSVPWTRVTTIASTADDMFGLQRWEKRLAIAGIAQRDDLYALARSVAGPGMQPEESEEAKSTLNKLAEEAKEYAGARVGANRGTALHAFCEEWDRTGSAQAAPPAYRPHVEAYGLLLAESGLTVLPAFTERRIVVCPVCNPEVPERVAGRTDRLVCCADGAVRVLDVKSEKEGRKPFEHSSRKIAVQLALYANCSHVERISADGRGAWADPPEIATDYAYVLHVPAELPPEQAYAALYPVNIRRGWEGVKLAFKVRAWRREKGLIGGAIGGIYGPSHAVRRQPALPAEAEPTTEPTPEPVYAPATEEHPLVLAFAARERAAAWAERLRDARTVEELSAVWREASAVGEWTDDLQAIGKDTQARLTPGYHEA